MKNLVPRFGKRDVTRFMDLTYMEYLLSRRKINLPRVIIRYMEYVINVPNHELPYGELLTRIFYVFHVSLNYKKEEDPKRFDFFEETVLTMCQLKRENGIWWLRTGEHRRRDDEIDAPAANEEVNEEGQNQGEFDWEVLVDEAALQGESGSGEKFYDAEEEVQGSVAVVKEVP
ncbi:hypothetical protein Dimus_008274 [Dionaea muscipula]